MWDSKEGHEDLLKGNTQVQDLLVGPIDLLEGLHTTPVIRDGAKELVGHVDKCAEKCSWRRRRMGHNK